MAALLVGAVWLGWVAHHHDRSRSERQVVADQTALRLNDWIVSRMLVLNTYSAMRARDLLEDPTDWRLRVQLDVAVMRGFQAINWVDDDGVIRVTAPIAGNEGALGRAVLDNPMAGPAFEAARRTRTPQASRPLDLFQGGRGFTTYLPIGDRAGVGRGYTNGVFKVDGMASEALSHLDLAKYAVVIRDGDDVVWASRAPEEAQDAGVSEASLAVAQQTWTVSIGPAVPVVPRTWHAVAAAVALGAALAAAAFAGWLRRQTEQTLQARADAAHAAARLIEMERMEAVGRVAGGIAHDFNNLLTVVVGNVELLELDLPALDARAADGLAAIRGAARQGSDLTEALLTFASRGARVRGHIDTAAHLRTLTPMLRHVAGRSVQLRLNINLEPAPLDLDATAFDRILINLITNAGQALVATPDGQVNVDLSPGHAGLQLTIRDNGPGMSADVRARVFEPYFTTRASGNGLGLATVFGLVTQAQGSITIETSPGQGCICTITLPLARPAPAA